MTKARLLLLSVVLLAAGFLVGRAVTGGAAPAPAVAGRKVASYRCPMHPSYKSDKPGAAPCCGMALEPVYEDGGPAAASAAAGAMPRPAGTVTVSADLRQLQGVRLGTVQRTATTQTLRLYGRVTPDESRVYALNAALDGYIRELSDVTTGSLVRKDQKIGAWFSPESRATMQAYITSLDVIDMDPTRRANEGHQLAAGTTPNRNAMFVVERLRALGIGEVQIEEMRKTRVLPLSIDIVSPVDGVVLSREVTAAQKVEKGMPWFKIAALDKVWILADVTEADADLARPGAKAKVTVPGLAKPLTATVSHVPPIFDGESRTMKVRLELPNPGLKLRPEMFVDVELDVARPEAIVVSADAVIDTGVRKTVFVQRGEGVFEPRAIETGWRHGDRIEVLKGLEPGDQIVVSGTFLVDSESRMKAAAAGVTGATVKDPVCGMEVDEARATSAGRVHQHGGKTYHFCSDACRARFEASPGAFVGAAAPKSQAL